MDRVAARVAQNHTASLGTLSAGPNLYRQYTNVHQRAFISEEGYRWTSA